MVDRLNRPSASRTFNDSARRFRCCGPIEIICRISKVTLSIDYLVPGVCSLFSSSLFFFFLNVRRTSEQIKIEMNDVMIVEIEFEFDNRHKKPLR